MDPRKPGDVVPIQLDQPNKVGGQAIITAEEIAAQAWTEGRRLFVAAAGKQYDLRSLGNDYDRFLAEMTKDQRQEFWCKIARQLPHSAGAFFAELSDFYEILEERLRNALADIDIAQHKGPKFDL